MICPGSVRADDAGNLWVMPLSGADTANSARVQKVTTVSVHGDGHVVAAGWFIHTWNCKSGI